MKNRICDVEYCGVRQDIIKGANPVLNQEVLASLYEFIKDRYEIRKKKDVQKLPAPWTDNPIFQQVKFTNVFRHHDRESLNVINGICKQPESLKDRFFNIILMRFWNKWESYSIATGGKMLKFPLSDADFNACMQRIADREDHTWWSGAYYTCPVRSWLERIHFQKKIPASEINFDQSPIYFAKYVLTDELWKDIVEAKTQKEVFDRLTSIPWMGNFLVYQWFVDFTYNEDYWFSENEFTISGPGCTRGLDLLFEDRDGMTHEECLFWCRDNQDLMFSRFGYNPQELFDDLEEHDRRLSVMAFENLYCELQKYMKCKAAIKEGKKPRGKASYNGLGIVKKTQTQQKVNLFDL